MEDKMRKRDPQPQFLVHAGMVLTIPMNAPIFDAKSQPKHDGPRLPYVVHLREMEGSCFVHEIKHEGRGKVLFLPSEFHPGDAVRITWEAGNGKSFGAEVIV